MNPCPAFHFLVAVSAGSAWIAVSIVASVAKMRKEGVAVPKSIQVPIPAPVTSQASLPIQAPKASVAIGVPISVLVLVVAVWAPKLVAIQAPKTIEVFTAK